MESLLFKEIASTLPYSPPQTEPTDPVPELQEGDGEDWGVSQLQCDTSPRSGSHYGTKSVNGYSGLIHGVGNSVAGMKLRNGTNVISSGVDILKTVVTETNGILGHFVAESDENPNLEKDSIQNVHVPEWDVEKVIEEQETHDLYCPKCNSCITKRVILKKRKRTPQGDQSSSLTTDANLSDFDGRAPPVQETDQEHVQESEVFTCLSCFSFFIPSGGSFNPFRIFGFKGESASKDAASLVTPSPNARDQVPLSFPVPSDSLIQPVPVGSHTSGHDYLEFSSSSSSVTHKVVTDGIGGTTHSTTTHNTQGSSHVIVSIPEPENNGQLHKAAVSNKWDVLKSIVYGGLLESITSLAVVSSAAGGDAGTLNIVALGLANLVGGLFLIFHNLMDLKNEPYGRSTDQNGLVDRYQEILGSRENFGVHVIVAVLSYILFGLVAPITYGFSFRESDNKDYKLIAVAAAALFCITLLANLKACVQKAPRAYIKTTFYYLCIGVMSSGLPYVAGTLVNKFLTDLGLFSSSVIEPVSPPSAILESMVVKSFWGSY